MLVGDSDFSNIKSQAETDNVLNSYISELAANADAIDTVPSYTKTDGTRLDYATDNSMNIINLAAAYKLTGNEALKTQAKNEMLALAKFQDWNPIEHFLDTAGIMKAMSIGYSWLYNDLSSEEKTTVAKAIYEKGILEAKKQYDDSSYCNFNWTYNKTNWNFVCNSALIISCLAVGDNAEYNPLCADMIKSALDNIRPTIEIIGNDGAWFESTSYAQYGIENLIIATEAMRTRIGTDYGYGTHPNVLAYADFIIYTTGANETFNYGDGGEALIESSTLSLISEITKNNFYGAYRYTQLATKSSSKVSVWDIAWYNPDFADYDPELKSADRLYKSIDTAVFHNGFFGSERSFAALHGGKNNVEHGHLDAGSFVYDANGVRFVSDLGGNAVYPADYFGNNRYQYYRTRAEAHNTLVIDPSADFDQVASSVSEIIGYKSTKNYGYAIVDTSDAYTSVSSSKRGIYFDKTNNSLLVQDEINLKGTSDVYWFMNIAGFDGDTGTKVELFDNNTKAVITRWGKSVTAYILTENASFELVEASSMFTLTPGGKDSSNSWYKKLKISMENISGSKTIAVYLTPDSGNMPDIESLNNWK